jgi:lambda family phage tail tape measure protein
MADLKYSVEVDTARSQASLRQLQDQVQKTQQVFAGFQSAIAGLAVGAFVVNAVRMAAALDDVANASGIALDKIVGFGQAVAANGGSIEGANGAISRFARFIDEAANGSATAQNTFADLGISFRDLQTLSEADLLRRTVQGLANVDDNAKRTTTSMQIFGKSLSTVDFRGVNDGIDQFTQRAGPAAAAIKAAADAEGNFAVAINNLQVEVLAALAPISELAKDITLAGSSVKQFIESFFKIALAIGSLLAVGKAVALVKAGFVALSGAFTTIYVSVQSVLRTFEIFLYQMGKMRAAGEVTMATIRGLGTRFGFLTTAVGGLTTGLAVVGTAFYSAYQAAKAFFGLGGGGPAVTDSNNDAEVQKLKRLAEARKQQEQADKDKIVRQVAINAEVAKERKAATDALSAFQNQNAELNNKFALQTKIMGMTDEQRLVEEEAAAAQERYLKAIEPLQNRINEIRSKGAEATASELAILPELQAGINTITAAHAKQEPIRNNLLKARIDELLKTKELAYQSELLLKAEERRLGVSEIIRESLLRGPQEATKAYEEMQLSGMSGVARKLKEIEIEERRLQKAAMERIAAQFSNADGDIIDAEGFVRAVDQIEAATKRNIGIRQAAARNIGQEQRTFADGWRRAFREYSDAATNAATQAGKIFNKVTQGMEDAIVNFAKTGKFEFKSFAASILEELLRGQIQQGIASVLGPLTKLMGLDMGNIGGQAPGGTPNNPMYVLDVAGGGRAGGGGAFGGGGSTGSGGVFGGLSNVFSGITNTISNIGSTIGSVFSGVTSGIGDLISGGGFGGGGGGSGGFFDSITDTIGDFFGGFFANGGTLGAGKFGIAGENGPEFIRGPASVTPMGGGAVTYNINAVDAASFKALVAADPGFIHAVAMAGAGSVPGRR